jgi:hypothetical protein
VKPEAIKNLTDDALTERVAALCGGVWKPCECGFEGCLKHERWHWPDSTITNDCPDYAKDLNAMHEAGKTLDTGERGRFMCELARVLQWPKFKVRNIAPGWASVELPFDRWFECAHATARQRAEAFVQVKS